MAEFLPLIRILLGWAGIWLASRGLPPEIAHALANDPAVADAIALVLGLLLAGVQLIWWRIAKRMGWAT